MQGKPAIYAGKTCNICRDFPAICKYYRFFPADIAEKPPNHPVNTCKHLQCKSRGVSGGWTGWAIAHTDFGRIEGTPVCTTCPPRYRELLTPLKSLESLQLLWFLVDWFSKFFWPHCEERTRARASLEHAKTNSLISLAAVVMRGIFPIFVSTSPLSIIFYIYSMTQWRCPLWENLNHLKIILVFESFHLK